MSIIRREVVYKGRKFTIEVIGDLGPNAKVVIAPESQEVRACVEFYVRQGKLYEVDPATNELICPAR